MSKRSLYLCVVAVTATLALSQNAFSFERETPNFLDGQWVLVKSDCTGQRLTDEQILDLQYESAGADPHLRQHLHLDDGQFMRTLEAGLSCKPNDPTLMSFATDNSIKYCGGPLTNTGTFGYDERRKVAKFIAFKIEENKLRNILGVDSNLEWGMEVLGPILILYPHGKGISFCIFSDQPYFYYIKISQLMS